MVDLYGNEQSIKPTYFTGNILFVVVRALLLDPCEMRIRTKAIGKYIVFQMSEIPMTSLY